MINTSPRRSLMTFLVIWFGQTCSLLGSSLSGFALGVWVYQTTRNVTLFAFIALVTTLPSVLVAPFAGVLVDRWDRRHAMILSDLGAGACTIALALLLRANHLLLWHIYLLLTISACCGTLQFPAYAAVISQLVPKEQLGRANGLVQLGQGVAQITAPLLGALLVGLIGVNGVFLIDGASFIFAVGTLLLIRLPLRPPASGQPRASIWREARRGWGFIAARPGLLALLALVAATNFTFGMVEVLFPPLILTFASTTALGVILSIGGIGLLAGSALMIAWGGPRRKINGTLGFHLISGLLLLLGGLQPNLALIACAAFVYMFSFPITEGCNQVIWQRKVPLELQGRVFATRRVFAWGALPLAYALAGPLAQGVFEPLLAADGPLAGSLGRLIGVGPGRGIGLLFIVLGGLTILATSVGAAYPRLRKIEDELSDADSAPAAAPDDRGERRAADSPSLAAGGESAP